MAAMIMVFIGLLHLFVGRPRRFIIDAFQLIEQFYRYLIRHETVRKVGVVRPRAETAGIAA